MNKNWILFFEIVSLGALFLAPLSLIAVDSSLLFPYITSKSFAWRFAISIAFAGWASLAVMDVRYRFNWKNPVFLSLSAFMLIMLLANLLGLDPYRSFWSNAERMDGYIGLLHMYAFFIVLLGLAQKPAVWKSFLYVMIGLGVLLGVVALGQDKDRADAWLGNPIYLASFSSFALFACGYLMMAKDKLFANPWLKELVFGLLALFFVVVIFKTGTRGAILGLVFGGFAGSLALGISVKEAHYVWWRRIGITGAVAMVILIGGFFASKDYLKTAEWAQGNTLLQRSADFSLEDTTTIHRLANWGQAIDGFKERPLLGWGQENYIHVFSKYYRADVLYNAEQWFDRTHNMFLDWLVFGGILGFGSFITIIGMGFWVVWKRTGDYFSSREKSVLTAVLVAYMAQNFVAFDALATGMWFTLFLAIIALGYKAKKPTSAPLEISRYIYLLPILWIFTGIWIYQTLYIPRAAVRDFMAVYQPVPTEAVAQEEYAKRYTSVEESLSNTTAFSQEFIEQLLANNSLYLNTRVPSEIQESFITLTVREAQELLVANPQLTRVHVLYGGYLKQGQSYEKSREQYLQALETSPHKLSILWNLGEIELLLGNKEASQEYYRYALSLAPESPQAQDLYEKSIAD